MSLLRDAERQRVAQELLAHKVAIEKIATEVVNDIIIRRQKLLALKSLMESSDNFNAEDMSDLITVMELLISKVQYVHDLVTQNL